MDADTRARLAQSVRCSRGLHAYSCDHDAPSQQFFCGDCGEELDQHDVDANLASWGVFRNLCSDCCGNHPEWDNT